MFSAFKRWNHQRKTRALWMEFVNGFDYAAGVLLRGENTPYGLERLASMGDAFDHGVLAAVSRLVEAGIVSDDRP